MNVDASFLSKLSSIPHKAGSSPKESEFSRAYGAQLAWSQLPLKERLSRLKKVRSLLVHYRRELADAIQTPTRQGYRETVAAELLPLADAARWVCRRARKILKTRYASRWVTPFWLGGLHSTVERVPHGLVLIIGAGNYPLLLTGVQTLQALAAGNGVVIKPAPGAERVTELWVKILEESGVPEGLILVLDSSIAAAEHAMEIGVDKVVMTGSSASGRTVLGRLANSLTPATMELSGCDAVYVLPGADMHRVCDLLLFGLRLNGGATCMAPRRVFITRKASEVFHRLLAQRLAQENQRDWSSPIPTSVYRRVWDGVENAVAQGAKVFESHGRHPLPDLRTLERNDSSESGNTKTVAMGHLVLTDMTPAMDMCSWDIFAPVLMIIPVDDWADALQADSQCPYALSASIFGPLEDALRITKYITAGCITINDLIVPTADPQLPFGGRGESGFGVTRGDEGLLSMTVPKVVSVRKGAWLPHAQPPTPADESVLDGLLQCVHSSTWLARWNGVRQIVQAILAMRNKQ
ncbi:Putative succinate-semialdehyde dehydrogenase [NADP(+)] 2 [Pirellula sp. SH-Sr6A]|uniref:aldehyde dehydrogenase family protein n=1 Tax=Pirellula sp. SH-Sr6A TaxID=1632865 RepID=UPI00078E4487|nr:aldehyde dehydrogenase family protein [Pirellula sp. SH-Sr6A]AMV34432.1 Putative succinate-semialdehyde dehydrogenase [NADP(+)] 2 [Pirellula sp. SH-Sr6A]